MLSLFIIVPLALEHCMGDFVPLLLWKSGMSKRYSGSTYQIIVSVSIPFCYANHHLILKNESVDKLVSTLKRKGTSS